MSRELEYIQRQIDIVKQQVKGSKVKFLITDIVTKHQYDYYENELQTLESIEQALQRLESIEKANPSEALECLEEISKEEVLFKSRNTVYMGGEKSETFNYKDTIGNRFKGIATIKQALLKAQKEHNSINLLMQELDCKDFADLRKYARCGYEKLSQEKGDNVVKIIKEKCVDIFRIKYYITSNKINELEEYKRDRNLTDEELELLKEVLE